MASCWPPTTAGHGPEVAPAAGLDVVTGHVAHTLDHAPTQGTHDTPGHAAGHTQGQDHGIGQWTANYASLHHDIYIVHIIGTVYNVDLIPLFSYSLGTQVGEGVGVLTNALAAAQSLIADLRV